MLRWPNSISFPLPAPLNLVTLRPSDMGNFFSRWTHRYKRQSVLDVLPQRHRSFNYRLIPLFGLPLDAFAQVKVPCVARTILGERSKRSPGKDYATPSRSRKIEMDRSITIDSLHTPEQNSRDEELTEHCTPRERGKDSEIAACPVEYSVTMPPLPGKIRKTVLTMRERSPRALEPSDGLSQSWMRCDVPDTSEPCNALLKDFDDLDAPSGPGLKPWRQERTALVAQLCDGVVKGYQSRYIMQICCEGHILEWYLVGKRSSHGTTSESWLC
ncbi:hypothetical protein EDB92DRAFT_1821175 [Lactarius akahatsu]|uniref:Uncharacterized protein n=1 Tax=Lactarius akahatsu TaxID=416441 RepID=A0AAD4LAM8_9AGAM|nr:hypothetical protein EDB92DRAFT_1821175 [Lactarius akahatsu]